MVRHFFPGDQFWLSGAGDPPAVTLAPGAPFTLWTARTGGSNVSSQLVSADGVTPLDTDPDTGAPVADSLGRRPHLYGPDSTPDVEVLWCSTGLGERYPMVAIDSLEDLLTGDPALPSGGVDGDILYRSGTTGSWGPLPSTFAPDWADILNKPTAFPAALHTHPASQVSDSTAVGRAVMTAADQLAARSAIGAGTGNGTSNLTLGTTATTAAAGNHVHQAGVLSFTPAAGITATNVQTAIEQASAMGGGGGSGASQVLVWRYTAGAWPALPVSKPTGVYEVRALGPTYPTTIPSWAGLTAAQIPLSYSKVAVA